MNINRSMKYLLLLSQSFNAMENKQNFCVVGNTSYVIEITENAAHTVPSDDKNINKESTVPEIKYKNKCEQFVYQKYYKTIVYFGCFAAYAFLTVALICGSGHCK